MKKTTDSKSRPDPAQHFVAKHIAAIPRSGIRDFFDLVTARDDVISLGVGEPDFVTPWKIREAAIYALDRGATTYTANLGLAELRRAITRYLARSFRLEYDGDREVLVTVGVSEALDLAVRAHLEPGDAVLYHEPCFVAYAPLIRMAHGVPVAVPTGPEDGFALNVEALRSAWTPRCRILLLNFPNNPTGSVLSPERTAELAAFAVEKDLLVITDEVYSELTYDGERGSIAGLPGLRERTIFLNGLSKAWAMTGFRLGFACAPAPCIEAMMKIHQYGMMCAPVLSQHAAIEALDHCDEDIQRMRRSYEARRNLVCAGFNEIGLDCDRPRGAFYAFPSIRATGMTSREFAVRLLEEENVACVPGSAFGECGEGFVRCCYATELDKLKIAIERIGRFVKKHRG